jgi:hypothetical protein
MPKSYPVRMGKLNLIKSIMKIKAIFKGKNGSQGFERNKEYELEITTGVTYPVIGKCKQPNTGVPYESIDAFLKNWDNIRRVGR